MRTQVAGFEWRPLVPSDSKDWSELLAALEATDGGWVYYTEDVLFEDFADPDRDYERGSVIVRDSAAVVGYGVLSSHWKAVDEVHELRFEGGVHPGYRHRGVGAALMSWAETAAPPIHHDRFPDRAMSLATTCMSTNAHALTLYAANGYQPVRWFHAMARDLFAPIADAPVSDDVQIIGYRTDLSEDARLVRNEAFLDHWGSTQSTVRSWSHFMDFSGFRPQFSFLAYIDDEPVGMLISHEYDQPVETADVRDVYVAVVATRRTARNRGIASALLTRTLREAAAAGFTTCSLGVDADSMTGAVGVYERVGFAVAHSTITHSKSLPRADADSSRRS
jgi:mycothiol synthase